MFKARDKKKKIASPWIPSYFYPFKTKNNFLFRQGTTLRLRALFKKMLVYQNHHCCKDRLTTRQTRFNWRKSELQTLEYRFSLYVWDFQGALFLRSSILTCDTIKWWLCVVGMLRAAYSEQHTHNTKLGSFCRWASWKHTMEFLSIS